MRKLGKTFVPLLFVIVVVSTVVLAWLSFTTKEEETFTARWILIAILATSIAMLIKLAPSKQREIA